MKTRLTDCMAAQRQKCFSLFWAMDSSPGLDQLREHIFHVRQAELQLIIAHINQSVYDFRVAGKGFTPWPVQNKLSSTLQHRVSVFAPDALKKYTDSSKDFLKVSNAELIIRSSRPRENKHCISVTCDKITNLAIGVAGLISNPLRYECRDICSKL